MSSSPERRLRRAGAIWALGLAGLLGAGAALAQSSPSKAYPGLGRAATASEIAAWDIDVRPDFKGLPKGKGSVAQGQVIWESRCSSCHGIFGESNEVFTPLIGGTTAEDVKTGRVARLTDAAYPGRTTLMKLPTLSTLWDYINRAMPWNAPKSLKPDEVYAVTAFMLNLGGVVPENFTLSDANMAQTQALMPNRNGMTTQHGMWPGRPGSLGPGSGGKPDVQAVACMNNCRTDEPQLRSFLPDFARNAHGNLEDQNRLVGTQRGAVTDEKATVPAATAPAAVAPAAVAPAAAPDAQKLAQKHLCLTCHALDAKVVGPSMRDIAKKYAKRADSIEYLTKKIAAGSVGVWGPIPMPAQTLPPQDLQAVAKWLADGAR